MNRQQLIGAGKVWQVYRAETPETVLFEGNKTRCFRFVREQFQAGIRAWKKGHVRVAKVIWEAEPLTNTAELNT